MAGGRSPQSILEPTCGKGAFLVAAESAFPQAERLLGLELNPEYAATAVAQTSSPKIKIQCADFFSVDWPTVLDALPEPILVIGNPPWVTNSELGTLDSRNLPQKVNRQGLRGLDAMTGKSNFDISEWMIVRLLEQLAGRDATLAMLCKTAVARKVLLHCWKNHLALESAQLYAIDAARHFDAAVAACLFVCRLSASDAVTECAVFDHLDDASPATSLGFRDNKLVADVASYDRWRHLQGGGPYRWRSGVKHDCSPVMEFTRRGDALVNGLGETVDIEDEHLYPLLKSSHLASGAVEQPSRYVLLTQQAVGQPTEAIRRTAPRTWAYLEAHAELLDGRKSSIYKGRPRFSVFGVGPYSFAPYKVAISGFYKQLRFSVVGASDGKPIQLDDTCYFIPCQSSAEAEFAAGLLNSDVAHEFFSAFAFWDSKRPITVAMLEQLDLRALAGQLDQEPAWSAIHPNQQAEFVW